MEFVVIGVLAILAIAAAAQASTRLRVAAPLLLVVVGIGVSLLPGTPEFEVDPEWIIAGVLPPLLYSAAVSMPAMEFRRDFRAISGLSVVLVIISAVGLGLLFAWLIPGLGLAIGFALGAIVSPTDAVATSIIKKLGVSARVVTVLEGESLLNDASALVLLRSAIAAAAVATFQFGAIALDFAYAVVVAVVIGAVVGWLNLRVRSRVKDPAVNTALSFTIPFLASVPVELLGGSGLVAAVTAGLVTGRGATRWLTPSHRFSDAQNWRTIELLLEGVVFLVMGLELSAILADAEVAGSGIGRAAWIAAVALVVVVLIRAAFVIPLLWGLQRSADRAARRRDGVQALQAKFDGLEAAAATTDGPGRGRRVVRPGTAERFRKRVVRFVADVDYVQSEPLGVKEGVVVVWAGMRGVVTLAAAQTLPSDTPHRSLLILIAFFVAATSLLVQGGTLAPIVRRLGIGGRTADVEERGRLSAELRTVVEEAMRREGFDRSLLRAPRGGDDDEEVPTPAQDIERVRRARLAAIHAQRDLLLELQKQGTYSSSTLSWALAALDADEISIELRSPGAGDE